MKHATLLLAVFFTFLLPRSGHSCSCRFAETFCEQVGPENSVRILRGTVWQLYSRQVEGDHVVPFLDVIVTDSYHGDATPDTISLAGQDGLNCATSMNETLFPTGMEMVFFVYGGFDTTGTYYEGLANYPTNMLSGCGPSYLQLEDGMLRGTILPGVTEQSLTAFVTNLPNCLGYVSTAEVSIERTVRILPNPSKGVFRIQSAEAIWQQAEVFDLNGKMLQRVPLQHKAFDLDLTALPAGVYFLRLRSAAGNRITKKIVVK